MKCKYCNSEIKEAKKPLVSYMEEINFTSAFDNISTIVNNVAKEKGWWDVERNDGEIIALMHSELSEALEGLRHGNPSSDHISNYTAIEEELADVIIRIMDYAAQKKLNISNALIEKIKFNNNIKYKHGSKKL